MPRLSSRVLAARERLATGIEDFKARHRAGCPGGELCRLISDQRDRVVGELFDRALEDITGSGSKVSPDEIALVAHGGYGRRDVAPYSDVDLMILHTSAARHRVVPLAEQLTRDVVDSSLILGHSVRTPDAAAQLACQDAVIATSLVESRLLAGSQELFERFESNFRRQVRRLPQRLIGAVVTQRSSERTRYGEAVYLLEPNVKRSAGTLRDIQLVAWIGFLRYGTRRTGKLGKLGVLSEEDVTTLEAANEFLLRLRNELHFQADKSADVLDRAEQLRIAEEFGYSHREGMLPIEQLMRDYFRHTNGVSHVATRFVANARSNKRLNRLVTAVFGHRVEPGLQVGPAGLVANQAGLQQVRGSLAAIMKMADLANLYNKPIAPETWEAVRREAPHLPDDLDAEACGHFLSLLGNPARLGTLLRDLHDTGVLERFVPAMARARGLLQFNQYHKYTVDEHSLRAVESAAGLLYDMGPLGRVYRRIARKDLLHLALLIHDLGKGYEEDHSEVGVRIAGDTASLLGLTEQDAEAVKFLVQNHLLMNHLAFRRDTSEEQLLVRFARDVGSPDLLRMLFVLTAADLDAVGPDVLDDWKTEILTELYQRTMRHLAGDSPAIMADEQLTQRRRAIEERLGPGNDQPWFVRQLDGLSPGYLATTDPEQVAADLRLLHSLGSDSSTVEGVYLTKTDTVQFTIGTSERVTSGVFHKLTGALTSCGLEIRSAEINTLTDGLVLDRFTVYDPDFAGQSPQERIDEVTRALMRSLDEGGQKQPSFRRTIHEDPPGLSDVAAAPPRVNADVATSPTHTILDVFANDSAGLLYQVARALFELDLSVSFAKIGTYLDQVVDVFYVTDLGGEKITDRSRLDEIRRRLLAVISSPDGL